MSDTIGRIETWLAIAADRMAQRTGITPRSQQAAEASDTVDERRADATSPPSSIPLDVVLAKRARQFAALSSQASLVDLWTAQLLARPYLTTGNCSCNSGALQPAAAASAVDSVQRLETQVTQRLLNTYRTITRTNTGRLIDVVV